MLGAHPADVDDKRVQSDVGEGRTSPGRRRL